MSVLKKILLETLEGFNQVNALRRSFSVNFKKFIIIFFTLLIGSIWLKSLFYLYLSHFVYVRGVYLCWSKYFCECLWALIKSTHSGDYFLQVWENSHFYISLCGWPQNGPTVEWATTVTRWCWGHLQIEKPKWEFFETFSEWSLECVDLIRAH